jgi:hypothetical protein
MSCSRIKQPVKVCGKRSATLSVVVDWGEGGADWTAGGTWGAAPVVGVCAEVNAVAQRTAAALVRKYVLNIR